MVPLFITLQFYVFRFTIIVHGRISSDEWNTRDIYTLRLDICIFCLEQQQQEEQRVMERRRNTVKSGRRISPFLFHVDLKNSSTLTSRRRKRRRRRRWWKGLNGRSGRGTTVLSGANRKNIVYASQGVAGLIR